MPRPRRCRRVCAEPAYDTFSPNGIPSGDPILLTVDEYEAIRLVDYEKRTHEQCAALMDISRTTATEIYESARYKIADSLVNGRKLCIAGGHYRLCDGMAGHCAKETCRQRGGMDQGNIPEQKKEGDMRIAVTYENGDIFQHFGHTGQFKFYDIEDKEIVKEQVVGTMGNGHGALAGFLSGHGVDVLICGGIGGGAQMALAEAGIRLYGGASGSADDAVRALLSGNLSYDPDARCSHHDHQEEGHCAEHGCGENKHGCHGDGGGEG